MIIEELKELMCVPADAGEPEIAKAFERIANIIQNECVIKYLDEMYRILDFEFYFYNKNHQDISTHPRISEALCWYINDFGGIDLNFESKRIKKVLVEHNKSYSLKYELSEDSYFGGVIIRQVQRLSDKIVFDGPLKVAELFRILDATTQIQSNPTLEETIEKLDTIEFKKQKRHNLFGSHKGNLETQAKAKADYIIRECFTPIKDSERLHLEQELASFYNCEYRYCWVKP